MATQKTTSKKKPVKKTASNTAAARTEAPKTSAPVQPAETAKPVKTYKGLCLFLIVFLYLEFFALLFIQLKYNVSLEPKRSHYGYTIQRQNLPAYQKKHPTYRTDRKADRIRAQKQHHAKRMKRPEARAQARRPAPPKHAQARPVPPKHHQGVKPMPAQGKAAVKKAPPKPAVKCPEPVARKAQYVEAQYAPYAAGGKAKIQGKACFTLKDGSEKCLAGLDIYINPVTDYSNEWYERGWVGTEYLEVADKRVISFNKSVKTAQDGSFTFDGLAPGSYYVVTQLCLPTGKDAKTCEYRRYGTKVTMKNLVKPTLKQLFPKAP